MSYIKLDRKKLVNLKYALNKEVIRSNRAGAYASTSIIGCNTRKYHGLLITPFENGSKHLLLSEIEETIIQKGKLFRLGIRRYPNGKYYPHGNRYIINFETEPIPARTYRVGGVVLKKELLLKQNEQRILIKYTIIDAHSDTTLRLQPFLAFRNIHSLSKVNMNVNSKVSEISNGVKIKMYENYPFLYMQTSKKNNFIAAPDWYYNIEYEKEQKRGYNYSEDLFVPGFFDIKVKKDDVIIFSAGITETNIKNLKRKYMNEAAKRIPRNNFRNNLINAAQQFFVRSQNETLLTAGFHWYDFRFRESFISLAGLTLPAGDTETFLKTFDSTIKKFFESKASLPADVPLFIFRTLQQFVEHTGDYNLVWNKYGENLLEILQNFKENKYRTEIHDNGLLYINENDGAATWMSELINDKPVTNRIGYTVEVNALWYNAIMFLKEIKENLNIDKISIALENLPDKVGHFYKDVFWNEMDNNLYDFVNHVKNTDIRPNQIFAVSLPYSPLPHKMKRAVLKKVKSNLLTERGLRTISPQNSKYKGFYKGNDEQRKKAKHQGTVHPWLIEQYCNAHINFYGEQGKKKLKKIWNAFEKVMGEHGLGTISELYDGNPPHKPRGAISYAPSVAALLNIKKMIK